MLFIKKNIWWFVLFVFIGFYSYFQKGPCETPIEYKIGAVDPRFGVSQGDFQNDINQASEIWGKAISKQLFKYDPNGSLIINLVYDTRQQITQKEKILNANIDQNSQTADSVKQQYSSLKEDYQIAQQEYTGQLARFNQAQDDYNNQVDYWNNAGGAPETEYNQLTIEKDNLLTQQNLLEQKRQQVNQLSDEINAFIDKYNLLVDNIKSDVSTINNDGLTGTQFEEGVYISDNSGTKINVYQFENKIDLVRVLAHELGHSMHLEHNTNPSSIMNPVNQNNNLILSPNDFQELKTECGLK